jgi:AraC-like DNA-binding protein
MLIIRKNELHCFYRHVPAPYRRIILGVGPAFFKENNCQEYEEQFLKSSQNRDNKISASIVKSSGLLDAFLRYQKYSKNFSVNEDEPVLKAIVVEILYLIHKCSNFTQSEVVKDSMKPVITYLNTKYKEDITLDRLCERFYLSKPYLCKAFMRSTGLTINEYIRKKRLAEVKELKMRGMNISEAAVKAGFRNYTAFYRAYKREYGRSPREDLG